MSERIPVIYVDEIPGRYFARYPRGVGQKDQARELFVRIFHRLPGVFYMKGEFIYMPITQREGTLLITTAKVK